MEIRAVSGWIQLWWIGWVSCLHHHNAVSWRWGGIYSLIQNLATASTLIVFCILCHCREPDGQASGGDDSGSDDWIFNTIREKDLKKFQNGAAQPAELERKQVRPCVTVEDKRNERVFESCVWISNFPFDLKINLFSRCRRVQRGLCHKAYQQSFLHCLLR